MIVGCEYTAHGSPRPGLCPHKPEMYRSIKKHFCLTGLLLLVALYGCQQKDVVSELQQEPYFDLKGLINRQIAMLDRVDPPVEISAQIAGEDETQTTRKDSAGWQASLKLLTEVDINKPVLQGSYLVKDSMDRERDLQVKWYVAKRADAEIPYLKVFYQDSLPAVRRIEAAFRESNLLYTTQRKMSATFDAFEGSPRLTQYQAEGTQKVIFKDSIFYQWQATIRY